ncbi:MAG TPA: threonine synthase [Prolixibacteraceae bacterium]|nr:threonine synthase [Prolixibacteraceae bacterium]
MFDQEYVTFSPKIRQSSITHLKCSGCGEIYAHDSVQNFCTNSHCQETLLAEYDLKTIRVTKDDLKNRQSNMWRYREFLPITDEKNIVSLGEGGTPLFKANKLSKAIDIEQLYWKDEGGNPTGSFKARGMSAAISKAKELGIKKLAIPTAGNAGVALAAYGTRAGMHVHVYMPRETPLQHKQEVRYYGAQLTEIDGNIGDCGKLVAELCAKGEFFNVSTLKEPYRLEGKKTMGYELAEQFNWELPDVILYPTGGGTGLIGFWKAFEELEKVGWIGRKRPRVVAVQSTSCDGIVSAFHGNLTKSEPVDRGFTIANGLRVPKSFADKLILKILRQYNGTAVRVSDLEINEALNEVARLEGMFIAPEGAALWAALKQLKYSNWIRKDEKVVLINTGSGYKYLENIFAGENI